MASFEQINAGNKGIPLFCAIFAHFFIAIRQVVGYDESYTVAGNRGGEERSPGMYPIVKKRVLNETVTLMEIQAPLVARKAQPGSSLFSALMKRESACR